MPKLMKMSKSEKEYLWFMINGFFERIEVRGYRLWFFEWLGVRDFINMEGEKE